MIGLLIKNGSTVIGKEVWAGDATNSQLLINAKAAKNPSLTFEIHNDTDPDWQTAFLNVVPTSPPTPDQTAWTAAKAAGPLASLSFLAKRMGLE